jgi:ATP-dependent DNA helicase DinG
VLRSQRHDAADLGIDPKAVDALLSSVGPLAVVDLETTGLSEDPNAEIAEVGIVLLDSGSASVRTVDGLIHPERPLPLVVQRLTGLTDADLASAPRIGEVAREIGGVLAGRAIVAHNASFERHFLGRFVDPALKSARYLDTQDLFSVTHPDTPDLRLETFTRWLLGREERHRALEDAVDTAQVISVIGSAALAGERRYSVARRCLERFSPKSPWLPLVAGSPGLFASVSVSEDFDAPPRKGSASGEAEPESDPFEFIDIGESLEEPVPFDEEAIALALADVERGRRYLPSYRVRNEQIELARHFVRNLAGGGTLLLEGGTGVGKSFAYLAAAIPFVLGSGGDREPLVVSTRTKLLQDQLLHKDIAAAARFLGYPQLRALSIKGRANYLCERRLKDVLAEGGDGSLLAEDRHAYAVLLACARTRPHGEIGTLPGAFLVRQPPLRDMLRRSVAFRADQCSREECGHQKECPFGRRRAALAKADVIVANHDLLLRWPPDYPKFKNVIIDEGHELSGVVDEVYATTVRPQDLIERVDDLFPAPKRARGSGGVGMRGGPSRQDPKSAGWRRDLRQDLTSLGRSLSERAGDYGEVELPVAAGELYPDAADLADRAAERLLEVADAAETLERDRAESAGSDTADPNAMSESERATMELRMAAQALRVAFEDESGNAVAAFEDVERPYDRWTLSIRAVSPSEPFHEGFLQRLDSVAILSASLFVGGDAFAALGELEIEERTRGGVSKVSVESPFPYSEHMRVVALEGGYDLVEETAQVLAQIARQLGGRTLGLFTSLRRMNQVAQRLAQLLRGEGIEVLTPRRATDDPGALVERFARSRGGAVLLGARTFWQGLDIPGPALQAVVIEKLPFDVPTELRRRREDRIRSEGLDAFDRFALGKMLLHLKQMTGRLIRSEEDRGVVVIVEGRTDRRYFSKLEQAMPPSVGVRVVPSEDCGETLPAILAEIGLGDGASD